MKLIKAIVSYYEDIQENNISKEEFEGAVEQHILQFYGGDK